MRKKGKKLKGKNCNKERKKDNRGEKKEKRTNEKK